MNARGKTSAESAANAALDHMKALVHGSNGSVVTMAVPSDGSYGIKEGVFFGMPVIVGVDGIPEIVQGIEINSSLQKALDITEESLVNERYDVAEFMPLKFYHDKIFNEIDEPDLSPA